MLQIPDLRLDAKSIATLEEQVDIARELIKERGDVWSNQRSIKRREVMANLGITWAGGKGVKTQVPAFG